MCNVMAETLANSCLNLQSSSSLSVVATSPKHPVLCGENGVCFLVSTPGMPHMRTRNRCSHDKTKQCCVRARGGFGAEDSVEECVAV